MPWSKTAKTIGLPDDIDSPSLFTILQKAVLFDHGTEALKDLNYP